MAMNEDEYRRAMIKDAIGVARRFREEGWNHRGDGKPAVIKSIWAAKFGFVVDQVRLGLTGTMEIAKAVGYSPDHTRHLLKAAASRGELVSTKPGAGCAVTWSLPEGTE